MADRTAIPDAFRRDPLHFRAVITAETVALDENRVEIVLDEGPAESISDRAGARAG